MTRKFVVIPSFMVKWRNMGLTDEDMRRLEMELLENPKIGAVMKGTGGVRKMRFSFENTGKSGATRVIYIDFEVYEQIFLLDAYAKDKKENLTQGERNDIRQAVRLIDLSLEESGGR